MGLPAEERRPHLEDRGSECEIASLDPATVPPVASMVTVPMAEDRTVAPDEDPVCGMTVNVAQARTKGLAKSYEGREFVFCGKGCFLEFGDDPETFLASETAIRTG